MKLDDADPAIVLKATPQRAAKGLLDRAALSLSRPELQDKPVLTVTAAAGFGKTSLLSQWRREWLARGAIVAWLSLDEDDDPIRFGQALAIAMDMASGRPAFARISNREPMTDDDIDRLTDWLAEVANLGVESALILDEVDRLPSSTTRRTLPYLLNNLPPNLRIVLASRLRLALPLSELVAHGLVGRVSVAGLRFSLHETTTVLRARFGAGLDSGACARLHDLSDGWPLGLQLAIATIEKSPIPGEVLDLISARTGDIRHYFVDSLIDRLRPRLTEFLVRVAILDRLHPSLCEALTGWKDAAATLEELRSATPIVSEGIDSEWSRIHPLAREFLLERHEHLPATERQALHAAASEWLLEHQMYEEAARHALNAGRPQTAWALAERSLYDLFLSGQSARVLDWVERLPASEIEQRPRLMLAAGAALALSARYAEAEPFARRLRESPHVDANERFLATLVMAGAALYADAIDVADSLADEWRDSMPTIPQSLAQAGNGLAALAMFHGNPPEARLHLYPPGKQSAGPMPDRIIGSRALVEGLSYLWEGQVVPAEEVLREAHVRAEAKTGRRGAIAAALAGPLALALWDRDETDQAARILANRLDVIERFAPPDGLIASYVVSARLAALADEEQRSFSLLEGLNALGETRAMPRLCVAALTELIRLHAQKMRGETCEALLVRLDAVFIVFPRAKTGLLAGLLQLQRKIACAYAAVARADWAVVEESLESAGPLADRLRRGREAIEIKCLRALALKATGRDGVGIMREAKSLADAYGFRRLIIDTHPHLVEWARELAGRDGAFRDAPRAAQSATRETDITADKSLPRVSPSALLTPKEREILQLLARRLSNKQIAAALDVGATTVKWHLKNVFGKLNAGAREHAIQRARMLGILEGH